MKRLLPANKWRKIASYFLPGDVLNEAIPIILVAYGTILSHLRSQAVSDSLNDLNDDEVEEFMVNNTNVNVRSVSNAVMWNCQNQSNGHYYRGLYITAVVLMITFYIASLITPCCRPEFWCRKGSSIFRVIFGGFCFNIGLTFLILSFDVSPWSCILGPERMDYTLPDESVDLLFDPKIAGFIKAAPVISIVCLFVWFITDCAVFTYDFCHHKKIKNVSGIISYIFEEIEYDTDGVEATEDDDTYYEINYVTVKTEKTVKTTEMDFFKSFSPPQRAMGTGKDLSGKNNNRETTNEKIPSSNNNESKDSNSGNPVDTHL